MITATAPGKVAIIGEYAVLEGAPALVMAVDRRVSVSLSPHDAPRCSVSAPGWSAAPGSFELGDGRTIWAQGEARPFALATHVVNAVLAAGAGGCRPFDLVLDSTALTCRAPEGPRKLGLGSSAAVTVALWRALRYHVASPEDRIGPLDLGRLIDIHAGFQDNRGSGLDVAASLYGGLIEYYRSPGPRACPARLPDGVGYCLIWSGRQAVTGGLLAGIDRWRRRHAARYRALLSPLVRLAEAAVHAARHNDGDGFLNLLDEYAPALEELGNASGTDILSRPHRRLREIAAQCGVVYKPCGAGSGDIGIGLSRHSAALARFRSDAAAEGFPALQLNQDPDGVKTRPGG